MFSLSRIVYITDALWAPGDCSTEDITTSTDEQYVLDGGIAAASHSMGQDVIIW